MDLMAGSMALAASWADGMADNAEGGDGPPVSVSAAATPMAALPQPQLSSASLSGLEMALFEVDLDHDTLTESLAAYGDPADPLIPVGELSRLLDLDVAVRSAEGSITGRIGESGMALTVDLKNSLARIGAVSVPIDEHSAVASGVDIYIKASVLQRLLPLKITADPDDYRLSLHATEKLPIQARRDRQSRLFNLTAAISGPDSNVLRINSGYRWLGFPAFDINAELGYDNARNGVVTRFEGRVAADLLKTDFTGYLATDDNGKPAAARMTFERHSENGDLFGPLKVTYAAAGDVYSPALVLGPRSYGGAGATISSLRSDDASVFQHISMRGELPVGYDVELYINDILYAGQNAATQGRYEFQDVPLVRGLNVIRVVTFGPRGQRSEQTRVINVGGGQLAAGQTAFTAGIIAQDRPVVEFANAPLTGSIDAKNKLRFTATVAHGLTSELTASAGIGLFTDQFGRKHQTLNAGASGSLLGTSLQLDYANDLKGGSAVSLGAAGRLGGLSFLARHIEYQDRFVDENITSFDLSRPMRRHSEVTLDFSLPFIAQQRLPISARIERSQFIDGGYTWIARGRTSLSLANTLVAISTDYTRRKSPGATSEQLTSNFSLSRLVNYNWQLRAAADVDFLPKAVLRSLSATVDHPLSKQTGLRLGVAKAFGAVRDFSAQAGLFTRMPYGEVGLSGSYSTQQKRWQVGLQLNFGFAHDPITQNYRLTPPGPASGGSAAIQAFVDDNGNGQMDRGEAPMPGIAVQGGANTVRTDANGHAFITGLGNGRTALLHADSDEVDTTFMTAPPANISLTPHAGSVAAIPYPYFPSSELVARIKFRRPDGELTGLSSVRLRLVPDKGEAIAASTEFDGTAVFDAVRPGHYRLEIDPDQAHRIGIALKEPVDVVVDLKGHQLAVIGEVVLDQQVKQ